MHPKTVIELIPILAIAMVLGVALGGCTDARSAERVSDQTRTVGTAATADNLQKITLTVPDMACPLCAKRIERTLTNAGLRDIATDLEHKLVTAKFDPERTSPDQVKKLVTDLGYQVSDVKVG